MAPIRRGRCPAFGRGARLVGDTLVVPQKLERIAWLREIKDITSILAQLALVGGVMLAAGI